MKKELSFRERLEAGTSKEELMRSYALSEEQYRRVLESLATNSNRKGAAL